MLLLYTATTPFLKLINLTVYLIISSYQLCHYFGSIVFSIISATVNFLLNSFSSLALAAQILVEDFGQFLADLYYLVSDIRELLVYLIESVVYFCFQVHSLLSDGWIFVKDVFIDSKYAYSTMEYGFNKMERHVLLVKDSLLLIGYCVWGFCNFLVSIFTYVNEAPYIAIIFLAKWFDALFYKLCQVPYESICGLCILASVLYFTYKANPDILENCNYFLITAFKKMKRFIIFGIKRTGLLVQVSLNKTVKFIKYIYYYSKEFLGLTVRNVILRTPTKAALKIELEREKAERLCVVCLDRKRNTMLLHCKHLCMCRSCAYIIGTDTGECPICRAEISEIITVYT